MTLESPLLEAAIEQALSLSPLDKVRLVERVMGTLKQDLSTFQPEPRLSLYGICADLGPAPSAEDIDEVRREVWANFPREDI